MKLQVIFDNSIKKLKLQVILYFFNNSIKKLQARLVFLIIYLLKIEIASETRFF